MRKENSVQNIVIVVLAISVLVMTVGYAAFSQTLTISSSTATFKKAVWDIRFDTTTFSETSTIHADQNPSIGDDNISFKVTLPKPGDVYSFTIKAKNFGTIDAKMKKITMTALDPDVAKFVEYKINYNGTDYTATTDNLNHAIAAQASHTITVTVKYLIPASETDLPTTDDVTVNLTADFDYEDTLAA